MTREKDRFAISDEVAELRNSFLALVLGVRKHWVLLVVVFASILGAVTFITLSKRPVYEATGTVLFDPNVPRPLGDQVQAVVATDGSSYLNNKEYYRTQMWMLRSMRVATEVVRKLGLHRDEGFIPKDRLPIGRAPTVEDAAKVVIERLAVDQVRESRLITVKYRDPDPVRAHRVLTVLVDTYVQQNLDDIFESATTAADWLRTQLVNLRRDLESSEMALHEYKRDKNILSVSMDDQSNMLRAEMQQLNQTLAEVRARRERVAARVQVLNAVELSDPERLPALELIESPVLQRLRETYVDADKALRALLEGGKGERHPDVLAAQAARNTTRAALLAEVANIKAAFDGELQSLNAEIAGLETLYRKAETRALELNLLEIEYNRLLRTKHNNEKLFSLVVERSKETDLTRMLKVNNIRVVDRPLLPEKPVSPNVPLNLAGGAAGGLLLGLAAAVLRERLDRTVKSPEHIESELNLPFLGILPRIDGETTEGRPSQRSSRGRWGRRVRATNGASGGRVELIVHEQPTTGVAEAARTIRTNLMFMSPDRPYRKLLVTSSAPMEGKTTVACALATTMAQAGQKVAIIDCDLRRPRLHRIFDRSNDCGVTSGLIGTTGLDELIQATDVPNLCVVTAGPLPPNPAELLHSEAFSRLLEQLGARFDRIVLDSPPLVPVTDGAVLSTRVDGTVLVVRMNRTTREIARRGLKSLRDVGGKIVGGILNAADVRANGGYYQYYEYRREAGDV